MTVAARPTPRCRYPHPAHLRSHFDGRPVEFWPTSSIRSALETGDVTVWQRIVVAIKRDPYGRTARQVEEVLESAQPYGISKALSEVLVRARSHLEANERAEAARHVRLLLDRSGLGEQEFASRIGVAPADLATYLDATRQPPGLADDPDAPAVGPIRQDARPTGATAKTEPMVWSNPDPTALQRILHDTRTVAVVGASSNPLRPSYGVYDYLVRHSHYELYPVNPDHHRNRRRRGVSQPL